MPAARTIPLELPDGRLIGVTVLRHPRYRSVRLTVTPAGEARISAPQRTSLKALRSFVDQHAEWLARHLPALQRPGLPDTVELRALAETWTLISSEAVSRLRAADGVLLLPAAGDPLLQLDRWLRKRARTALGRQLQQLSVSTGLPYGRLSIRAQRSRWGSFSSGGNVSLNWKLLFLPPELVRYVLLHELCHGLHMDHSPAYWAALTRLEPRTPEFRRHMRSASRFVPDWAAGL